MPNLDEIKARRDLLTSRTDRNMYQYTDDIHTFHKNAPTDIDWLIAEVERLRAEKAQAEAQRDVLAIELAGITFANPRDWIKAARRKVEAQQQAEKGA